MSTALPKWRTSLEADLARHAHLPFANFVQIATVHQDGRPANRTLTFRFFLTENRLLLTADVRTEKISQIEVNPWAEACWYFTESRVQFRLSGKMQVVITPDDGELMEARHRTWQERTEVSRQSFTWPPAGMNLSSPENFSQPCPVEPPGTFALLIFTPERIEHLDLSCKPSERCTYWFEENNWHERRINP